MNQDNQMNNEFDYTTRDDVNIAILREIAKIRFRERLPLVMAGVARHLVAAGTESQGTQVYNSQTNRVAD
jgi:hypothetical protein